jgi:hypothetical protein
MGAVALSDFQIGIAAIGLLITGALALAMQLGLA